MMEIKTLIQQVKKSPETTDFANIIEVIDTHYNFTETAFQNGDQHNAAGENNGSCKIFSFAQLHNLNQEETLACFGQYYFDDVLNNPTGNDHQNIRQFIKHGWHGINFENPAIAEK